MEWVETTGKTLEEAKDAALDQLGVAEDDAEFEVLEEPKAGLFGRVRGEARVRARVRPTKPRPKDDRRDRKRRSSNRDKAGVAPTPAEAAGGNPPDDEPDEGEELMADDAQDAVTEDAVTRPEATDGVSGDEEPTLAEQADVAETFLLGLADAFGVQAAADRRDVAEDTVEVSLRGEDLGYLIGPRGTTLSAVQDLARTVVQRKTAARTGRLLVDVAGYRQRRKEALERFTLQVAEQVKSSGTPKVLEPMSAADRKVVHDACNEIDGVTTTSQGEEPRRYVVISPAD